MRTPLIWFAAALIYVLPFFTLQGFGGAFIKIGDIKGESMDSKHPDEIEVLSWSWGATQPATSSTVGMASPRGAVSVQDFTFTHEFDQASPMLALNCFQGKHVPEATFTVRRTIAGGNEIVDYLIVTLTNVLVSSITQTGASGDAPPIEKITLNYEKIKFEYTPTTGGKPGSSVEFQWDLRENKEL